MKRVFLIYGLVFLFSMIHIVESKAQTSSPIKYNKEFAGIGPEVYILPPPKTEKERLQDQYSEKKKDQGQLVQVLNQMRLSGRLKQLSPTDSLSASKNQLGTAKLLAGDVEGARTIFKELLYKFQLRDDLYNQQSVLQNLALTEEQSGNYLASLDYYETLISLAKKAKNIQNEGLISLSIATIESKLGNYSAAHNLVLKRSFPLLRKFKYFPDVVNALNTLAAIKESEEKLIEAKWIYLQAIDVATIHKDERGLAVSLYNLAELKTMIGDASLAIADYKRARDLASRNKMNALLVEIEDGLGDAYLDSGDYKEAALALNSYLILKLEFIGNPTLM